jgi:mRNA interferase RelE/StbE
MFKLLYHPQCLKRLKKIPIIDKNRSLQKISQLSTNPFTDRLDIKKLVRTRRSYRLRIGDMRVIYEVDTEKKIIYIWEIDYRGKVY